MSDLALAGLPPLPIEPAMMAYPPGSGAADSGSDALAIAPGVPMSAAPSDTAQPSGFHAILWELADALASQTRATGANKRAPDAPPEGPHDEEMDKVGFAVAAVGFVEPAEPALALSAAEPAPGDACVSAPAPQEAPPAENPPARDRLPDAATSQARAAIEPPPGINVREPSQAPSAERMRLAFALALERQAGPSQAERGGPEPVHAARPSPRSDIAGHGVVSARQANTAVAPPITRPHPPDIRATQPEGVASGDGGAQPEAGQAPAHDLRRASTPHPEFSGKPLGEPEPAEPAVPGLRQRDRAAQPPEELDRFAAAQPASAGRSEARSPDSEGPALRQISAPPAPEPRRPEPANHEISLRVEADAATGRARPAVAVHVVERAGRIEIRVRSADPQLNQQLRRDIPVLMDRLEAEGLRGEILPVAAENATSATGLSRPAEPQAWPAPDGQGPRHGGAHPDPQQHRPRPQTVAPDDEADPGEMTDFRRLHDGFLG